MPGTTRYLRSTTNLSSDVHELVNVINQIAADLETFRTEWNIKQGGTPITLSEVIAYRLLGVAIPTTPSGVAGIAVTSGNTQSATVATTAANPLVVTVTDTVGAVVANSPVTWAVTGDATITSSSLTNASGQAQATLTLGTLAGSYTVTATASNGSSTTFTATGTAGAATTIAAASLTSQSGTTSTAVSSIPSVFVSDTYGNPKSGVAVTFAVTAGGGAIVGGSQSTNGSGVATCTSWTLGASAGLNTATATSAGLSGSPVTYSANASASLPTQIVVQSGGAQTGVTAGSASAAITFRVKDGGGTGVQGVTVSFSRTGSGSLSVSSAVSNASGDVSVTLTTHTTVETATVSAEFVDASGGVPIASTTVASTFGAASKWVIITQPASNGSSGTALPGQPVVAVADANGNTVTSATTTCTCAVQSGNASITANSTQAAVSGLATFTALTLTDNDGGANVLRFSGGGLTVVDSSGVTLAPPVPTALQFIAQPGNATEDSAVISCSVAVVDANGTQVPGATNTVALAVSGGATLSGTTSLAATAGLASFSALAVNNPGTYTLTATSTGLTSAVSSSFTISASGTDFPNVSGLGLTQTSNGDTGFDAVPPTGWTLEAGSSWTLATDSTAPFSPSNVAKCHFNAGHTGGTGVNDLQSPSVLSSNHDEIAFGAYVKFSSTVQTGGGSGVQKLFHVWGTNGSGAVSNILIPGIYWSASLAQFRWNLSYQAFHSSNSQGTTNPVSDSLFGTLGLVVFEEWYRLEVYAKYNTGSNADGTYTMWIRRESNGATATRSRTNLVMTTAATRRWSYVTADPTTPTSYNLPAAMDIYFDHYRMWSG